MKFRITAPGHIDCSVALPPSKSYAARALAICAIGGLKTLPANLPDCEDTRVMLDALSSESEVKDLKACGTAMRFLTAVYAIRPGEVVLTGCDRLKDRPMRPLVDALRVLGAKIEYLDRTGFPPLKIRGVDPSRVKNNCVSIDGSVSSQFVSALMMISPAVKGGINIRIKGELCSKPYVFMTLETMRRYGFDESVPGSSYRESEFVIPTDWSSAAYWYEIMALISDKDARVMLPGLHNDEFQADSVIRELAESWGVRTSEDDKGITLTKRRRKAPEYIDLHNSPDVVPAAAVAAALSGNHFVYERIENLRLKECDRIAALREELGKLGYKIDYNENDGSLSWDGEKMDSDYASLCSHDDHRMAMSLAPAALTTDCVIIDNPDVTSKSYPDFWRDLENAGFKIERL